MALLRLFAYGTLQVPDILQTVVGQRWPGKPAVLSGYARYRVAHKPYPAIVVDPTGSVPGVVYSAVSAGDLELLDSYEGALYERRELSVRAGGKLLSAVAYVLCERHRAILSTEAWELADFERDHLAEYLTRIVSTRRAP